MAEENRWVVLIYMAATSPELRELMERELGEMAARLRLLEEDRLRAYALMDTPDGRYAVRHALHHPAALVTEGAVENTTLEPLTKLVRLNVDLEQKLGKKAAFLADFIKWRFNSADATGVSAFDRTLLILWGHSQGVAAALSKPGSPAYAMVGNGGFGFNDISGESLSLPEIRRSIAEGLPEERRIDILSFDSCFMSAAEVSAEFQRHDPPLAPDADLNEPDDLPDDEVLAREGVASARTRRVSLLGKRKGRRGRTA